MKQFDDAFMDLFDVVGNEVQTSLPTPENVNQMRFLDNLISAFLDYMETANEENDGIARWSDTYTAAIIVSLIYKSKLAQMEKAND